MTLRQDDDGTLGLVLIDRAGTARATVGLDAGGQAQLRVADADGRTLLEVPEPAREAFVFVPPAAAEPDPDPAQP
jgi:hypothetical protein